MSDSLDSDTTRTTLLNTAFVSNYKALGVVLAEGAASYRQDQACGVEEEGSVSQMQLMLHCDIENSLQGMNYTWNPS